MLISRICAVIPSYFIIISYHFLLFLVTTSNATDQDNCTWTGAGSGNSWHTAENWDCDAHDGVPTATDAVTIAPEGTVTVDLGADAEVWSLELGIDDGGSHSDPPHKLRTTVDDVNLTLSGGGLIVRQTGKFDIGQSRVPSGIGARPALRATLKTPEPVLVHGRLFVANSTIYADVTLKRPDIGGGRGSLQARGWNNVHGTLHVKDGFLQPVVPGGYHGTAAPHLRIVDHDLIVADGASVQIFADRGSVFEAAIAVEGGIFDLQGLLSTSSFPNSAQMPAIIDAEVVNQGVIRTLLTRTNGLTFRGPPGTVHINNGLIEVGGLRGSDTVDDAIDGFGFMVEAGRELHNTGEIKIHRLRTAEGDVSNTDGGIISDTTGVTEAGTYVLGFNGSRSVTLDITETGSIELLSMVWIGEDPPDAHLDDRLVNTGAWWDLTAMDSSGDPASGEFSLSLPRLNSGRPQITRYTPDPAAWEGLPTVYDQERATVEGINSLSIWAVAVEPVPDPVTLFYPEDNAGNIPVELSFEWESASGAEEYQCQVSTQNDFSSTIIDSVLSQTSLSVPDPLTFGTTYYWRVLVINEAGESDWS